MSTGVTGVRDTCVAGPSRWDGQDESRACSEASRQASGRWVSQCPSVHLSLGWRSPPCMAGGHLSLASPQTGRPAQPGRRVAWVLLWIPGRGLRRPVSPCPQPRRCPGDQFPEAQTSRRGSWEQRGGTRECNSPVQPVHVGDADHLEEGEKDEVQGGGVAVEDLEPVAPGLQREAGGREEAGQAGRACTRTTRPLGRSPAALPAPRISSPVCPAPPPRALLPGAGGPWGWPERAVWGREGVSAPCT